MQNSFRAVPFFIVARGGNGFENHQVGYEFEYWEKMWGWGPDNQKYFIFMFKKMWGGVSDREKIEKKCGGGGSDFKSVPPLYHIQKWNCNIGLFH